MPSADRSQIPGHEPWVSLNIEKIARAKLGTSLSQLSSSAQGPAQTLGYLDAVTTASGTTKVSQSITMGLSDFGVPVHITAPPASQTFDATSKALAAGTSTS